MKLALLNTSIVTSDGAYTLEAVSLNEAKKLVSESEIDSAIGHEATAQILSELLGVAVPMNRQVFAQEKGQTALVFKLNGRPPEGQILDRQEIEKVGYSFKKLVRVN